MVVVVVVVVVRGQVDRLVPVHSTHPIGLASKRTRV